MHIANDIVRLRRQERDQIIGRPAFLHGAPMLSCPDAREEGRRSAIIERGSDVAILRSVELAERCERNHATVLNTLPAFPVPTLGVANVNRAAVCLGGFI